MRNSLFLVALITLALAYTLQFQAHAAAPAGPLIKHLSSLVKWTRSSSKTPQSDGNFLQFEDGYLVETVLQGNDIGVEPYKIRVSEDGELFAVDSVNSNVVRITPPLSQYSRARLVAGSFQGYKGHVDGKPSEARFNHPKGVTMDDKGNVYVADTLNLAIRKISDAVIDRGNAALRQISLNEEDCDYQYSSISPTDVLMVIGAVLVGYATCLLQQGFGPSFFPKMQTSENDIKGKPSEEKFIPVVEGTKDEPGWPSFGQLIIDLSKLGLEVLAGLFLYFVPSRFRSVNGAKKGLTPLKDTLKMPEDEAKPPFVQRQSARAPISETRHAHASPIVSDKYSDLKPPKMKSSSFKDPSLSSKHRSSKRQEYAEFYGSGEVAPPSGRSKSQKERTRHRQREKSGEVVFGAVGAEPKPVEVKPVNYDNPKFDHYNMRARYTPDDSFRF
ncbi:uncharacterized protein LOC133802215 isoform X3 [Humulus lupulus]|uniref:uncharacterized protein LOC133802215 isoform X3 n=1 Tax=Humulus lupulus TaxID=3486 RepID=UPI002B410EB1|nr:uncharacterized protein LOC133802215 isoform X3 [Humulus lupulus]